MGCMIYFKQCQEVNTVARLLLLGTPNTIEEEVIGRTINKELQQIEQRLISDNNAECKFPQRCISKWLKYAVVSEYPAGMPWEGAEEKKKKQGTNNTCLAFIFHVHEPDYACMTTLLAFAKEWKVWHKHRGKQPSQWRFQTREVCKRKRLGTFKWCRPTDLSSSAWEWHCSKA
jgi:hypothetical protein